MPAVQDAADPRAQAWAAEAVTGLAERAELRELLADACLPALVQLLEVSSCL